ncbi:hypothetical protein [Ensifer sp. Root127]|uniref:hypothetical protein n=1 Tax=Ensifer sp. Root127 TaxID=1736440 RepID=UPI00070957DE|nr:hypothetical protein [Ensifer sp. Root127]KQW72350.1 hypothetical protein ASD03_31795 [Ensifer sp. Root127]
MTYREVFDNKSIAVSTSESPDMAGLGLHKEHLRDAMAEIARHLLALGAKLVYGGDLRAEGFSNLLFELAARYRRDTTNRSTVAVTNYLAWPVHILQQPEQIDQAVADLQGTAELRLLDIDGKNLGLEERHKLPTHQPSEPEWAKGLSAMRHTMLAETDARIILGGRVDKFKGDMPGIAEEALYSLQGKQPLYVMGGFGGCARDVAEAIGVLDYQTARAWPGLEKFAAFNSDQLNNGLSKEENRILASTPHVDQAIVLILRGLTRVQRRVQGGMIA